MYKITQIRCIMNRYYLEIDSEKFEQSGEVEIVNGPVSWQQLFDDTIGEAPKGNFGIHRKDWLCNFINVIGGQRGKVGEYLIRKKDGQNKVLATNREIAAQTGVALATTNSILRELRKADCIRCRTAAVMLNPGVAHKGSREREAFLLKLYDNFENRTNK